jgi:hypothetical protein
LNIQPAKVTPAVLRVILHVVKHPTDSYHSGVGKTHSLSSFSIRSTAFFQLKCCSRQLNSNEDV